MIVSIITLIKIIVFGRPDGDRSDRRTWRGQGKSTPGKSTPEKSALGPPGPAAKRPAAKSFNLADVDLRLLKVLQAVVRSGGFSSAQSELGLSAATISNHMAKLEARLGIRLCERGRRGFSLTEDGARIHEASLSLFRSIDNFSGIVGSVRGELTGQVYFGTVDAMYTNSGLDLPRALKRFQDIAPKVLINIETASPQQLHQRLLHGRYFLILTPIQAPDTSIRARPIFEETQALYCGRDHPLFSVPERQLKPEMFSDYPYAACPISTPSISRISPTRRTGQCRPLRTASGTSSGPVRCRDTEARQQPKHLGHQQCRPIGIRRNLTCHQPDMRRLLKSSTPPSLRPAIRPGIDYMHSLQAVPIASYDAPAAITLLARSSVDLLLPTVALGPGDVVAAEHDNCVAGEPHGCFRRCGVAIVTIKRSALRGPSRAPADPRPIAARLR